MRALQLFSPPRASVPDSGSCLLVYAEPSIQDAGISSDIREIYNSRPSTAHIFILAPFCSPLALIPSLQGGSSLSRAKPYIQENGSFNVLGFTNSEDGLEVVATRLSWENDSIRQHPPQPLDKTLQSAWLFDLFDRHGGKVTAPAGVHFRKGSGKHADKFLRTANVLLSSHACGALAFFSLANLGSRPPRQVLVDTAPLISVAQAMFQVAAVNGLWTEPVPIKSFSSYGGLDSLPRQSKSDFALISASTSGALVEQLIERGIARSNVLTLFYLASNREVAVPERGIVCDLTYRSDSGFGYAAIENYSSQKCPLCDMGYMLADLEGDQFLFQKRDTLRIKVRKSSQDEIARTVLEKVTRKALLEIIFDADPNHSSLVKIDANRLFDDKEIRPQLIRHIRRFGPSPLKYVILDGISEAAARSLLQDASVYYKREEVLFLNWTNLAGAAVIAEGGALVLLGVLHDHARARQINATLRRILPKGSVTYISALTIAETPDDLADLKIFLEYGEHGRDTFVFRTVCELAYPLNHFRSAWALERELLLDICALPAAPDELRARLDALNENSSAFNGIFFARPNVELAINNDFVYLNTGIGRELISQADIAVVVANALATARNRDRAIHSGRDKGGGARIYSSLYGQALLCPENFRNYNDPILRAAFLRFAKPSELSYAADEVCSKEMLEVIVDEVLAWEREGGDALPEFLLSLACSRLSLDERHMITLKTQLDKVKLPAYLNAIVEKISF